MAKENRKRRFGTIAMSKGFITLEQFTDAIEIQAREELANTEHRRIGEILVDLGFMDTSQVAAVMNELIAVAFRFECPHCGKKLKTSKPGKFRCNGCKEVIVVNDSGKAQQA